ncbi:MAG: amidohydrolase family protein [Proteobacteria bacterium]|nr:amidohydrolase family protein [Pseudomonadota bacterium]
MTLISRRQFGATLGLLGSMGILRAQASGLPPGCFQATTPRVDIDVHCHVFNGSDLQVERFLVLVASANFDPFLRDVVRLLAKPLQRSVWKHAPTASSELKKLGRFDKAEAARSEKIESLYTEVSKATDETYAKGFSEELKTAEGQQFLDAYRQYVSSVSSGSAETGRAIRESLPAAELDRLRDPEGLLRQLEREKTLANHSIASVFTFVRAFYAYRFEHVYYLLKNYGCDRGTIQMIAAALVDYDYPLGATEKTPSPLTDQFQVMARLSEVFEGRLLTYLAFDPWRVANGDHSAFDALKSYITNGAATGIKLYPPMGFAPMGNDALATQPASWPAPQKEFGERLEVAMKDMWEFATSLDVPVIAHAGRSNAPYGDRVGLGSPDHWQKVFDRYPKARVCFGHFGGEGLLEETDEWPAGFLKQIGAYSNAYGDIAYFEDILGPRNKVSALAQRLSTWLSSSGSPAEKMMYGSDWVMLAIEAHSEDYFARFAKLFSNPQLFEPKWVAEILSANAQNFLGLHAGQSSRVRLEQFYKARAVNAAWLKQIT